MNKLIIRSDYDIKSLKNKLSILFEDIFFMQINILIYAALSIRKFWYLKYSFDLSDIIYIVLTMCFIRGVTGKNPTFVIISAACNLPVSQHMFFKALKPLFKKYNTKSRRLFIFICYTSRFRYIHKNNQVKISFLLRF